MKALGVMLMCLLATDLLLAITVKPGNKLQQPPTSVENRVEHTKASDGDRVVRYIPQHFSPSSVRHHHHHLPLDNLNLVRYLQSLPKATPQLPSIAYLYGSSKQSATPQVQAGFIYKARTQNYSNNNNGGNKDSYPVSATMYPIFNRPGAISESKYPQVYSRKPQTFGKVKHYSPFQHSNKIPGPWMPVNYKPYYTKAIHENFQKEHVSPIHVDYESSREEEEFVPIANPQYIIKHIPTTYAPPLLYKNHFSNKIHLKPEKSILNPAAIVPAANYEADKSLAYIIASTSTTTTDRPILITTLHSSSAAPSTSTPEYEFEEQLIYELPGNKSTMNIEHTTRINYIDEEIEVLPPLPYGPIELYKPRANHTKITPVPNEFKYIKMVKINVNPATKSKPKDYYDKDVESDYDDVVKDGSPRPQSGRPGIDFPILHEIPETEFSCKEQRYKGFFGDVETGCQVWHYCDLNGGKSSFLCPNGTIFSQHALTCDWWFNVKCANTAQLYVLNERLYKYILPFTPKFPQDFQGPLVDKYLTIKFEEMEEKLRKEKEEKANSKDENVEEPSKYEDNEIDEAHYGTVEGEIEIHKPANEEPQILIESTTKDEIVEATEAPQAPLTTIVYEREQQLQSIEPEVEIKNVGVSGHLTHHIS